MSYQTLALSILGCANIFLLIYISLKLFTYYKQNPLGLRKFFHHNLVILAYSTFFMGAFWTKDAYFFNVFLQCMLASLLSLSTFCLLFFFELSDMNFGLLKFIKKILLLVVAANLIISLTNAHHHLLYDTSIKNLSNNFYSYADGPWLSFMRKYSRFLLLVDCAVMLPALLGKNKKTFEITLCIFFSFIVTGLIAIFYDSGLIDVPANPAGFFMSVPSFLVYYACFEYLGKARHKAIDFMEDAYFVFDLSGVLIDKNESAQIFIAQHGSGKRFDVNAICKIIGIENLKTFQYQEFSINKAGGNSSHFRAAYFGVSDTLSQNCGHGFLVREITVFREQVEQLNTAANIDPLTEARNRRYFDIYCKKLYKKYVSCNSSLTLLMLDLDHFKKINDTYGHGIGDEVLKAFASICLDNLRTEDMLFRFGGEEFVVVIDGANAEVGKHAAERLRAAMSNNPVRTSKGYIPVTVSIGGCSCTTYKDLQITELVEIADQLLYEAKNSGRNKVVFQDLKKQPIIGIAK